jgi:hypothetical protein
MTCDLPISLLLLFDPLCMFSFTKLEDRCLLNILRCVRIFQSQNKVNYVQCGHGNSISVFLLNIDINLIKSLCV